MVVLVTPDDDGNMIPSMRLLGVEAPPLPPAFIAAAELPKYGFGLDPAEEFEFKKAKESAREMVIAAAVEDEGESCPNAARLNPAYR